MHSKTEMKTGGGRTHGSVYKPKWLPEFTKACKCLLVRAVLRTRARRLDGTSTVCVSCRPICVSINVRMTAEEENVYKRTLKIALKFKQAWPVFKPWNYSSSLFSDC